VAGRLIARFDVYRPKMNGATPLVLEVQADLLSDLQSRVIVPLQRCQPNRRDTISRLLPVVRIGDEEYQLATANIGTVLVSDLGVPIGNLENQRSIVVDANDFLLQGF
jgi:toxin CcdB